MQVRDKIGISMCPFNLVPVSYRLWDNPRSAEDGKTHDCGAQSDAVGQPPSGSSRGVGEAWVSSVVHDKVCVFVARCLSALNYTFSQGFTYLHFVVLGERVRAVPAGKSRQVSCDLG